MKKYKPYELIEVDWLDSCHLSGWSRLKNISFNKKDLMHQTSGYFFKETPYSVCIVQSKKMYPEENSSVDAMMEIPKVSILKVKKLKW